jgi:hypothetical protein
MAFTYKATDTYLIPRNEFNAYMSFNVTFNFSTVKITTLKKPTQNMSCLEYQGRNH